METPVKLAGDDAERLKALPEDTWDAVMLQARFYAQASWSRQKAETWSRAPCAAGGEVITLLLDAQLDATDGDAKEAPARLLDAYRAREID